MSRFNFFKNNWVVLVVFFVLTFIVYGQSLFGGFVYDDRNILEYKEVLTDVQHLERIILHPFWQTANGLYRPATLFSYSLNLTIFGDNPASFHFINLALYVLVCFSSYLLVKKLFKKNILAFTAALFFLLLPIHSEVVTNISGRGELLALLFSLLTMLQLVKEKSNFWLVGCWVFLAIGSKETAVALLPLSFLVLYFKDSAIDLKTSQKILTVTKKYFREISAILIAGCFYFFLRFFSLGLDNFFSLKTSLIENPLIFTDTSSRVATALKILWLYFTKMLWPVNLCADYSFNQIPVIHNFFNLGSILGFLLLSSSIVFIFVYLNKKPLIAFGLSIFIFSFLPVANILLPIGTVAGERLFFFPSLGLSLVIAFFVYKIFNLIKNKIFEKIFAMFFIVLLCFYGLTVFGRQKVWLNEENLFLSTAQCAPNSVLARSNAGAIYLVQGNLEKAEVELKLAMSIKPIYSKGLNNLGLVYFKKGEKEKARTLYLEAAKQDFPYWGAYENLVLLYLSEENINMAKHWLTLLYPNNSELVDSLIEDYLEKIKHYGQE